MGTGRLEGRIALITGTAQGIGRALARKLAAEGAKVVANDLDEDGLSTLEAEIREAGGRCSVLPGDVTQAGFGDRAVEACLDRFGDLHIVVNNAGYIWNARIVNHTDEQWQAMIDVHATAPFRLLRAVGRYFREQHEAGNSTITRKVVNVSSVSGLFGAATQFSYSAAKSAQIGMTRSLCKDWGRYNVTVNCVAFGFIETRLTQAFDGDVPEIEVMGRSHKVGLPAQALDMMKARIPLGRPGTPEEAAGALLLFCLPESDYISGEVIVAGGGLRD
jgi:3-oxoacyl-[acyl-carrier protein] reductase